MFLNLKGFCLIFTRCMVFHFEADWTKLLGKWLFSCHFPCRFLGKIGPTVQHRSSPCPTGQVTRQSLSSRLIPTATGSEVGVMIATSIGNFKLTSKYPNFKLTSKYLNFQLQGFFPEQRIYNSKNHHFGMMKNSLWFPSQLSRANQRWSNYPSALWQLATCLCQGNPVVGWSFQEWTPMVPGPWATANMLAMLSGCVYLVFTQPVQ